MADLGCGNGWRGAIESRVRRCPVWIVAATAAAGVGPGCHRERAAVQPAGESRAVRFLQAEVPAWSRENGCFSCHNNGDAARALLVAGQRGHRVAPAALASTLDWLSHPDGWAGNKGDPGFSDQRLADIQFAAALMVAGEVHAVDKPEALRRAAQRIAAGQGADGSWPIEPQNVVGSPATYGTALATFMGWRVLDRARAPGTEDATQRAARWLARLKADTVPAAAIVVMAGAGERFRGDPARTAAAVAFLQRAQTSDGGWGPYSDTPAEAFDTSLVLLALAEWRTQSDPPEAREMIRRGRAFLIGWQREDGSWPPTTRPSGGASYAQRMSTTGWATLALLATRELR